MMKIHKKILKDDDIDDIDDDINILIGYTTIKDQEEKSYYINKSYKDMVLYPDEKIAMCFELVNV